MFRRNVLSLSSGSTEDGGCTLLRKIVTHLRTTWHHIAEDGFLLMFIVREPQTSLRNLNSINIIPSYRHKSSIPCKQKHIFLFVHYNMPQTVHPSFRTELYSSQLAGLFLTSDQIPTLITGTRFLVVPMSHLHQSPRLQNYNK